MKAFSWQIYAVLAAATEASMGIFSKNTMEEGFTSEPTAFYACFISFLVLTLFVLLRYGKDGFIQLFNMKNEYLRIAISALFGIFILFYFETKAYTELHLATVVFVLLGSSTITTLIMSKILLHEKLTIKYLCAIVLCIIGLYLIFHHYGFDKFSWGIVFSIIAGIGYGAFFVLSKRSNLEEAGLKFLWWFLGIGSLYLFFPFYFAGAHFPESSDLEHLLLLAIIPTLGAYYFTVKALAKGSAKDVQIIQLSDPLFAALFGFIIFGETLSGSQLIGAAIIFFSLCLVEWPEKTNI